MTAAIDHDDAGVYAQASPEQMEHCNEISWHCHAENTSLKEFNLT